MDAMHLYGFILNILYGKFAACGAALSEPPPSIAGGSLSCPPPEWKGPLDLPCHPNSVPCIHSSGGGGLEGNMCGVHVCAHMLVFLFLTPT